MAQPFDFPTRISGFAMLMASTPVGTYHFFVPIKLPEVDGFNSLWETTDFILTTLLFHRLKKQHSDHNPFVVPSNPG